MIGDVFTQIVSFFTSAISAGSTVADGGLDFIETGSTAAQQGFNAVTGSLGNIFN